MKNQSETIFWLSILALVGLFSPKSMASQASPDPVVITQPDGSTFKAYIRGDEHHGWWETPSGFVFCKNPQNGFFEFAVSLNKHGKLSPSGLRVGRDTPPGAAKTIRPIHRDPHGHFDAYTPGKKKAFWDPRPVSGVRNVLAIQVEFADQSFTTPTDYWNSVLFADGPNDKSVVRFYRENSYGKVEIRPVTSTQPGYPNGIVRATLQRNHPNYGRGDDFPSVGAFNQAETEWLREALAAVDPFVNFAAYDANNNGRLSTDELNIYLIVSGYDASNSMNEPSIWAHAWGSFQAGGIQGDGLSLANYAMSGELHNSQAANPFGVIVHELGHSIFGLPDLYDTSGANSGMGFYSVMATGSFGRTVDEQLGGMTPGPMDPWSRYYLGWAEPRTYTNAQIGTFPAGLSRPDAPVMMPLKDSEEFFMVENFYPDTIWHDGLKFLFEQSASQVESEAQDFESRPLGFTPGGKVTGTAVRCGIGQVGDFPGEVAGQIALIQRGEITFRDKVLNAVAAGAKGVVIYNNISGVNNGTLGVAGNYVPAVTVAPEGVALEGKVVTIDVQLYAWDGGLMVLHVDPNNTGQINNLEENDHQGVVLEEANPLFGTLADDSSFGHVTHFFSKGNNDQFTMNSAPSSKTYADQDSGIGLTQVSEPGPIMTARITRDATLAYVVPWIVKNQQWSSRVAFYNAGHVAESPLLVATTQDGQTRQLELPAVASGAIAAFDAENLFSDLSGYSLSIYASESLYPSFLTFNLDAPSGASPAQTTGMGHSQLSHRLVFGYLSERVGGLAALVLNAPDVTEDATTTVNLSLYDGHGVVIQNKEVTLTGRQPYAAVLGDVFGVQVEEGAVIATAPSHIRLSGTTFTFNPSLEPAMALPFAEHPSTRFALPWIVSNESWSSRIALFNDQAGQATVTFTVTGRGGERQEKTVTIPPQSLWTGESGDIFPGLTGYSLIMESNVPVYPNFLAFNLNAASGRSPAQTSGTPLESLNAELVFPYVPFEAGGVSAIVLMSPLAADEASNPILLSLHNESGDIVETVQVVLTGKRPLAAVISDLFTTPPTANMTVTAAGPDEVQIAGTTFVFNSANEPSMSRAFSP